METVKKFLSFLSAISLIGVSNVGAVPVYNNSGIVTHISEGATSKEDLFSELGRAYEYYVRVLQGPHCLEKGTMKCEKVIQRLLEQREYHKLAIDDPVRRENEGNLTKLFKIFGQVTLSNLLNTHYDDEVYTLCYYNHIINGGIGTSCVWANYFSQLLNDKQIENYILNISDGNHIVAYKLNEEWYGITCYNSCDLINGEEISDLSTCLKNISRLHSDDITVYLDTEKCQYFRNLDVYKLDKDEMDKYEREGIYVEIPRELLNSGDWNTIKNGLIQKITQCHNPKYLRSIHPVYRMIYNLLKS